MILGDFRENLSLSPEKKHIMEEKSLQLKFRFNGTGRSKLDSQRRLLMPKLWRDAMSEDRAYRFYLMPGTDNDIKIGDYDYYCEYSNYIESLDDSDVVTLQAKTIFAMLTTPVEVDSQGRFALTPELLQYAQLGKAGDTLVLAGASDFGRIMTEEAYSRLFANSLTNISRLNQEVQKVKAMKNLEKK